MNFIEVINKLKEEGKVCHVFQTSNSDGFDTVMCNGNPAINGFLLNKSGEQEEKLPLCSFHLGILNELFAKNRNFQATNKLSLVFGHE